MLNWFQVRRPAPAAARARLGVETFEDRLVPTASPLADGLAGAVPPDRPDGPAAVYVESNNPAPGQNTVIGFRRNPADGSLRPIGTFATGGTGQLNVPKRVGPDDGDQQV